MNSHQAQNNLGKNAGRDEARLLAPEWLTSSLDLLEDYASTPDTKEISAHENFVSRVKTEVRFQESDRVLNDLPGGLAQQLQRALPGTVPGGSSKYFARFTDRVKERIAESNRPDLVSPALGNMLSRVGTQKSETLPQNYFDLFLGEVRERIVHDEDIPLWMNSALKGPASFGSTKDSFFDEQVYSIKKRLDPSPAHGRLTLIRSNRFRYSAVAASAACLAVFSFMFNIEQAPVESISLSSLHESYGVESVESILEIQESLVGSEINAQFIRAEIVEENSNKISNDLVEAPSLLTTEEVNSSARDS